MRDLYALVILVINIIVIVIVVVIMYYLICLFGLRTLSKWSSIV